jgi:hypothetical protein
MLAAGMEDDDINIPLGSMMAAFLADCLARFGFRPGGPAPSDEDCVKYLETATPRASVPAGYDGHVRDFFSYLSSALGLASAESCSRCGAAPEMPAEIAGLIVILYRRSEDDTEAARVIDDAVRAGEIQCNWGLSRSGELLCAEHASPKSRRKARQWWEAWNDALGQEMFAGRGLWNRERPHREITGAG